MLSYIRNFRNKAPLLLGAFLVFLLGCSKVTSNFNQTTYSLLSVEDKKDLEQFFSSLFQDRLFGYVLCGEKPVNHRLIRKECMLKSDSANQHDYLMTRGVEILKKFKLQNKNYLLLIQDADIPKFKESHFELTIINKKALINVVNKNLPLFQKAFGNDFSGEKLIQMILDHGFYKTFVGHLALQGIAFGYGRESSINFEQISKFSKVFYKYCNENNIIYRGLSTEQITQKMLSYIDEHADTWRYLRAPIEDTTGYQDDDVMIPFSFSKNSTEAKKLIKEYKRYHRRTCKFLDGSNLAERSVGRLGY